MYWLVGDRSALREAEWAVLADPENDLACSSVALWELTLKWDSRFQSGDRKGPADPAQILSALQIAEVPVLPLTEDQAVAPLATPIPHRDPFDRMLLVQAQQLDMKLFTRDARLRA